MTIELKREQKQIQKAARDFVKGEFKKEIIQELLENHTYPENILKKAGELGFLGIHFPESLDGEGMGHGERAVIAEELAKGHSTLGICLSLAGYGAELLLDHGTKDLKTTFLPRMAGGQILSSLAIEDENSLTMAVPQGDDWVITGTKTLVVNGGALAGFYGVLCCTDPDAGNKGLSTILVEAGCPGITVLDAGKRLGGSLVPLARVDFHHVRVPGSNLIGKENNGLEQMRTTRASINLTLAALAVGTAQGGFDRALAHVRQRRQFGKKLIEFQITRHKLALMATRIETARLMTRKAALACDAGKDQIRVCAMAKLTAARTAVLVCDEALQLFGGYGYIREYEIEAFYRDAKTLELLNGSPHDQKDTIAEDLLGKY